LKRLGYCKGRDGKLEREEQEGKKAIRGLTLLGLIERTGEWRGGKKNRKYPVDGTDNRRGADPTLGVQAWESEVGRKKTR